MPKRKIIYFFENELIWRVLIARNSLFFIGEILSENDGKKRLAKFIKVFFKTNK